TAVAEFASFGFCKAHAAAFAVPTYQSSWLKTHYPAHFLAGILTHDPGMYPRRLLLEDAREHGIPILPLDMNRSEPEYVVEVVGEDVDGRAEVAAVTARGEGSGPGVVERSRSPRTSSSTDHVRRRRRAARAGAPTSARHTNVEPPCYGIRLALQDVHGISDAEIRSILQARADRPFDDVGDFLRRTNVAKPVVEAIAHAGGFDRIGRGTRRDRLYAAMTTAPQREGDQLALDLSGSAVDRLALPEYTDAERVRAELEVLGLDASRHLVSFFEPLLADLGVVRSRDLHSCRSDQRVMVAGVKVASQTPAIRSGQRIIFLTLDDATGPVDVTVFESVQPKVAKTVFHSFVLAVVGTVRRTGYKGVSVVAEDVWDLTALLHARRQGRLAEALAHEGPSPGAAVPRKLWHSSGGSAGR
ncbi:MAG TPA: OB-fold nucleic acid binding domain-containing protein, partial [Actinomycetota bacterium]|nr:OB-fold nucleic acid binding domain-containing protein [Actinomycetota bacterium]